MKEINQKVKDNTNRITEIENDLSLVFTRLTEQQKEIKKLKEVKENE